MIRRANGSGARAKGSSCRPRHGKRRRRSSAAWPTSGAAAAEGEKGPRRANAIALPLLEPVGWVGNGNYYSHEAKAHLPFNFALRCWSQSYRSYTFSPGKSSDLKSI